MSKDVRSKLMNLFTSYTLSSNVIFILLYCLAMTILFCRHGGRYEYTALEADSGAHERMELERKAREQAQSACLHYLRSCPRYSLLQHLNDIGQLNLAIKFSQPVSQV